MLQERCGVDASRVRAVLDPPDAQTMALAITEEAQRAESALLVWFVGHGLLGPGNELYLAASGTDRLVPGLAEHQALSFATLRQALGASRAASVVVVLDCCFSGRAALGNGPAVPAFTMAPAHGMYLIGSAEQLALAPPEAAHTAFTGAFIELLTRGDPRGPHQLTLDAVYDAVFRAMRDQHRPLPRRQAGDRSGNLVLAPNPAVSSPSRPAPEPQHPGRCPYPGLDAFSAEDAEVFHGRERMTGELLAAVAGESGPVVLVGASGSGKTSLLNAGLLAKLHRDRLPGSPGLSILRLTPGTSPLSRLTSLLGETDPKERLVVIDQFEELFTLCADPTERAEFLRVVGELRGAVVLALRADFYGQAAAHPELLAALRDKQILVEPMTSGELRAAIERPAAAAGLALDDGLADVILHELGAAADGHGALPLLSHALWATWRQRSGARLTVAGYRASGGIAQAIATTAEQVYTELDELGQEAARRVLPRLVRVGEDSADTARPVDRTTLLHGLPDPEAAQQLIEKLTEARLLTVDRDTVRLSHEVLLRAWPRFREWVDADRDWLRTHQQLAEDATSWDRADRDPSLLYRGARLAALRERAAQAPTSATDLEPVLAQFMAESWQYERRGVRRKRVVTAFLAVLSLLALSGLTGAIVFQQRAAQAQDRDLARYLALEADAQRAKQPGLAKQLSLISYRINPDAGRSALFNSRRTPGVISQGAPVADVLHSIDGRVTALSTGDAILLRGQDKPNLGRVVTRRTGPIALNHNGSRLAVAEPGAVQLWDLTDPAQPRQLAKATVDGTISSIVLGGDRGILYAGLTSGAIAAWDLGDATAPKPLPPLRAHGAMVDSLAASPQRNLLASASVDGRVQLWSLDAQAEPLTTFTERKLEKTDLEEGLPLHRVAFDQSGQMLATPGDRARGMRLWRLDNPRAPQQIPNDGRGIPSGPCSSTNPLTSVAFSPANKHLVVSCRGGWDVLKYTSDPAPGVFSRGASMDVDPYVKSGRVVFSPGDGGNLLQATANGLYVWELSNPDQPGALGSMPWAGHIAADLVFRSDGRRWLVVVQEWGSNMLWDVTDVTHPKLLVTVPGRQPRRSADVGLSPDGAILASGVVTGDQKPVVRLHDTKAPGAPVLGTIDDLQASADALEFHPTKPILAVADNPTVRVYDIADPRHPRMLGQLPVETEDMAFSPDGTMLFAKVSLGGTTSEAAREIRGWDFADPGRPVERWRLPLPADAGYVHFDLSPNGKLLAVTFRGTLRLWRVEHGRPAGDAVVVPDIGASVGAPKFSPDGTRLALTVRHHDGADPDLRPEVWTVADPASAQLQFYLPGKSTALVESVAFSPDGRILAVSRSSTGVDFWSSDPEHILGPLCSSAGDPITPQQWEHFLPDRPYQPPCQ
nr:caspase family protein [Amycolatopsis sp. BJA-103]